MKQNFIEMQNKNAYFNEKLNETFEYGISEQQEYDDKDYLRNIKKSMIDQKKFAQMIQSEMHTRFEEK